MASLNNFSKAALTLWLATATTVQVNAESSSAVLIDQPAYREAFDDFYQALSHSSVEDLRLELFETIEDALSSGSHMGQVSQDSRVRHIESAIMQHVRQALCAPNAAANDLTALKKLAADSVVFAGSASRIDFNAEETGMISGVVVRLTQKQARTELCSDH